MNITNIAVDQNHSGFKTLFAFTSANYITAVHIYKKLSFVDIEANMVIIAILISSSQFLFLNESPMNQLTERLNYLFGSTIFYSPVPCVHTMYLLQQLQ